MCLVTHAIAPDHAVGQARLLVEFLFQPSIEVQPIHILNLSNFSETSDGRSCRSGGRSAAVIYISIVLLGFCTAGVDIRDSVGSSSYTLLAGSAVPDTSRVTLDRVLAAECACVFAVLADFDLLHLLTQRGTVARTVLACPS